MYCKHNNSGHPRMSAVARDYDRVQLRCPVTMRDYIVEVVALHNYLSSKRLILRSLKESEPVRSPSPEVTEMVIVMVIVLLAVSWLTTSLGT